MSLRHFTHNKSKAALLALPLMLLSACEVNDKTTAELERQVSELSKSVSDTFKDTQISVEEVRKLQQFEYQLLKFKSESSAEHISTALNAMGKNRWDCNPWTRLALDERPDELLFFCKRRPETPLKYIPRSLFGLF